MKFNFKPFLQTSASFRRGVIFVISILLLVLLYYLSNQYIRSLFSHKKITLIEIKAQKSLKENIQQQKKKLQKEKQTLFQFDPNTLDKQGWNKLGFTDKQIQTILNFKNQGGIFYKKEDIKKLYVINEQKYKQLEPYIVISSPEILNKKTFSQKQKAQCYRIHLLSDTIPVYNKFQTIQEVFLQKKDNKYHYYTASYSDISQAEKNLKHLHDIGFEVAFITPFQCNKSLYKISHRPPNSPQHKTQRQTVELNTADTTELKTLKGIGSYYARKIVQYRQRLGGFHSIEQLLEIYGIQKDVIDANKKFIKIDTSLIQKININTASIDELKKHPYIKWNVANSIMLYRANHGKYQSVQNIKKSDLVNDKLYRKIVRYLTVE